MLTKDLLRCRIEDGQARPGYLHRSGAHLELAAAILAAYRQAIGRRLGELDEDIGPVLHQARSLRIARGIDKLLRDLCTFSEPPASEAWRWQVLEASAQALRAPARSMDEHQTVVAASLGPTAGTDLATRLYADLPDQATLAAVPDEVRPEQLIDRYNMALVQGLLLSADRLSVRLRDRDPGRCRSLLKNLRHRRLLVEARQPANHELRLEISGPGAVLDQRQGYGFQLACFLPALACCRDWSARALIRPPRQDSAVELQLNAAQGLVGEDRFLAYVPEEYRTLAGKLAKALPDWTLRDDPPPITGPGGELIIPDLGLSPKPGVDLAVEIFHRWHLAPLRRRLDHLGRGQTPHLILAIDRALTRLAEGRDLLEHPQLASHGFLFSGFPSPSALRKAVASVLASAVTPPSG